MTETQTNLVDMEMNELVRLPTVGGDVYLIARTRAGYVLCTGSLSLCKSSLALLLFTIGGMVDWSVWTGESRAWLAHRNNGQAI